MKENLQILGQYQFILTIRSKRTASLDGCIIKMEIIIIAFPGVGNSLNKQLKI